MSIERARVAVSNGVKISHLARECGINVNLLNNLISDKIYSRSNGKPIHIRNLREDEEEKLNQVIDKIKSEL